MDIFNRAKDLSIIHQEIDGLQKHQVWLLAEKEVLTADLEGYQTAGYEEFKKVLTKEKVRIALKRMTIAAEEQVLHERLQGQFNECELLERNKENIERDIAITNRKISDTSVKIEKLKRQLKTQTERK